jgi:hypothetical protein
LVEETIECRRTDSPERPFRRVHTSLLFCWCEGDFE